MHYPNRETSDDIDRHRMESAALRVEVRALRLQNGELAQPSLAKPPLPSSKRTSEHPRPVPTKAGRR